LEPAPPPCQVKAQETSSPRKRINNITKHNPLHNQIKQGVLNGSIPSTIADSGVTSHVGTTKNSAQQAFIPTGQPSHKVFQLPNGMQTQASNIHHLHHNVQQPAKDVHIVPMDYFPAQYYLPSKNHASKWKKC
jgi:hypothetical protein